MGCTPLWRLGFTKYLYRQPSIKSLKRKAGLEYVDVFYHHRPDPETPLKETMKSVRSPLQRHGKVAVRGDLNYPAADLARQAIDILE